MNELDHHPYPELLSSPTSNLWELHTGAESRVRLDTILQWPVFEEPLAKLPRSAFLTFKKEQDYTYLGDMFSTLLPLQDPFLDFSTEHSVVEELVDRFFVLVHVKNPILDRDVVKHYCAEFCQHGPKFDLNSCLMLLICAIASIAPEYRPSGPLTPDHGLSRLRPIGGENLSMGSCYFAAAEQRIGAAMTQHTSLAVQCLCLAGIYHMYKVNPMGGHAMFHQAGYIMQMLASTTPDAPDESSRIGSSLYWACFKSEREIFAELPIAIPALGRPTQASSFPLPPKERFMSWGGSNDLWARAEQDSWYFFLSEIAMRRIIDKVAEDVGAFFAKTSTSDPTMVQELLDEFTPMAFELERQATAWREHLPPRIRFPDPPTPVDNEWMLYSRQPFYRTLELIHRPFVFAHVHGLSSTFTTRENAKKGLTYAQQYLQGCHPTHAHHGRALQLRNEFKMIAILFAASRTGLDMPFGWYESIRAAVRSLCYWLPAAPFLQSYVNAAVALDSYFTQSDTNYMGCLDQEIRALVR
ncbi:C6 zinc finger domain-containing protein [Phaeosphaeria sp. MPI-PUGE-AT-0046c]|nr:C6 zinc finger domain-containing protein [Phaeosphaeria sp. MPI-PUGE-AT-0046c]